VNSFQAKLHAHGFTLVREPLLTLQINVGRKCNQACRHCHVDAAPWRTEMMDAATASRVGDWIRKHRPKIVDLTGGAPELSEHFQFLVETARAAGCHVIDRCNLTILEEPGFEELPQYLARHQVEIIASLPCYSPKNVNQQRGNGVFEKSIRALQTLNAEGYGRSIPLNLVYNPVGATLPGPQKELESDYKAALREGFGIVFDRLLTITNQPIARFAEDLRRQNQWEEYLELLVCKFNPGTVDGLMCRTTLNVGYRGELYDCDFNQMLGLPLGAAGTVYLWDVLPEELEKKPIRTGFHCFACTAGAGSSCTGALA
jgi:radical SAM/Cys-rich protein